MRTVKASEIMRVYTGGDRADTVWRYDAEKHGEIEWLMTRDDGWTLAASRRLAEEAHDMWRGTWVSVERCRVA